MGISNFHDAIERIIQEEQKEYEELIHRSVEEVIVQASCGRCGFSYDIKTDLEAYSGTAIVCPNCGACNHYLFKLAMYASKNLIIRLPANARCSPVDYLSILNKLSNEGKVWLTPQIIAHEYHIGEDDDCITVIE